MRYLIIFEDNSLKLAAELVDSDFDSVADGHIGLVDMQEGKEWDAHTNSWKPIPEAN